MTDLFSEMVLGKLYGTLLRHKYSGGLYWSPDKCQSANDYYKAQPDKFIYIGSEGWWANEEMKVLFSLLEERIGDWKPVWPGEWIDLGDIE